MASGAVRQGLRVFVGNLPWTIGSHELRHFGSSFGPVVHSSVIFDRNTGLSKGYGFITFGNRDAVEMAFKSGNQSCFLEGNYVSIQPVAGGMYTSSNTNTEIGQ